MANYTSRKQIPANSGGSYAPKENEHVPKYVLAEIDFYEDYCDDHPKYENNRAVHAIAHIKKVYDERLDKHDFL